VGFPNLAGAEGNGQWDCATIGPSIHPRGPAAAAVGTALGGVCGTPAQTTVSRYQVYRYEIAREREREESKIGREKTAGRATANRIRKALGFRRAGSRPRAAPPFCANAGGVSAVDTTTGGIDRRNLIVPIVNCLAQTALGNISGAGASSKTPVAAFGKFFLTQPYSALKDGNLYGEITGLVSGADNAKFSISSSCTVRCNDRRAPTRADGTR